LPPAFHPWVPPTVQFALPPWLCDRRNIEAVQVQQGEQLPQTLERLIIKPRDPASNQFGEMRKSAACACCRSLGRCNLEQYQSATLLKRTSVVTTTEISD
jgi:hypothetical protein